MPQQILANPTALEGPGELRPTREREIRVQGEAGAFGMLLGALQGTEAGIVRGAPRNDSAAEWNAQDARDRRKTPRDAAQQPPPAAQQRRDSLSQLTTQHALARPEQSPSAVARNDAVAAPPRQNGPAPATPHESTTPGRTATEAAMQPAAREGQAQVAKAPGMIAAQAAAPRLAPVHAANQGGTQNSVSPAGGIRAAQGVASPGGARAQSASQGHASMRFERVFDSQVARGLAKALRSGDGSVTLRLKPESLGQLSVRVNVQQNHVTATFESRTIEAHRLLEHSRDALKQQLEARGLTVERIEFRLLEEPQGLGTRLASGADNPAPEGQDGRGMTDDRQGRGSSEGEAEDDARGGAPREESKPSVTAEPWRHLGTVRLDAIA